MVLYPHKPFFKAAGSGATCKGSEAAEPPLTRLWGSDPAGPAWRPLTQATQPARYLCLSARDLAPRCPVRRPRCSVAGGHALVHGAEHSSDRHTCVGSVRTVSKQGWAPSRLTSLHTAGRAVTRWPLRLAPGLKSLPHTHENTRVAKEPAGLRARPRSHELRTPLPS